MASSPYSHKINLHTQVQHTLNKWIEMVLRSFIFKLDLFSCESDWEFIILWTTEIWSVYFGFTIAMLLILFSLSRSNTNLIRSKPHWGVLDGTLNILENGRSKMVKWQGAVFKFVGYDEGNVILMMNIFNSDKKIKKWSNNMKSHNFSAYTWVFDMLIRENK